MGSGVAREAAAAPVLPWSLPYDNCMIRCGPNGLSTHPQNSDGLDLFTLYIFTITYSFAQTHSGK